MGSLETRGNIIYLCSRSLDQTPRFAVIGPTCHSIEMTNIDRLWNEARPLVERVCSIARFTVDDARRYVDLGQIVPLGLQNEAGDFTTLALAYKSEVEDLGAVLVALIAPDGPWDLRLGDLIEALMTMSDGMAVTAIALRSPDPILLRWETFDLPDGEYLLHRFDEPFKPAPDTEYNALKRLYGDG